MNRIANVLGPALALASLAASDPLKVTVVVASKPHLVGQGIEVRVVVDPTLDQGPPTVESPRVKDAAVFAIPADPARPSAGRFMIVPEHAGPLDLPAIRARSGDRSGTSKPIRLLVANVPTEGRTSAFLGGVGPFEVRAEIDRPNVRPGETLEARLIVSGLAAYGSVRSPALSEWTLPTLKLDPVEDRLQVAETPIRTFRYRLRPLKSGRITLPPVAVAAFDPTTRRYATRATSSLAIQVEEPPRFDPSLLGDPPGSTSSRGRRPWLVALAVGALAVVSGSMLVALVVARRRRKPKAADPRALALELSKGLRDGDDPVESARTVAEALTTFLNLAGGRPLGVLTPREARLEFRTLDRRPGACEPGRSVDDALRPGSIWVDGGRGGRIDCEGEEPVRGGGGGESGRGRARGGSRDRVLIVPMCGRELPPVADLNELNRIERMRPLLSKPRQYLPVGSAPGERGRRSRLRGAEQLAEVGVALRLAAVGHEAFEVEGGDGLVDQQLDLGQGLPLVGADEHVGDPVLAHPAGPADPVEVVLGVVGDVEVDDVADVVDVDASADDVGGDQHGDGPVAEALHDAVADRLREVAVDGGDAGDPAPEPVGQLVGPSLGPGEDDALAGLVAIEQVDQQVELPVVLDGDVILLDRLDRRSRPSRGSSRRD